MSIRSAGLLLSTALALPATGGAANPVYSVMPTPVASSSIDLYGRGMYGREADLNNAGTVVGDMLWSPPVPDDPTSEPPNLYRSFRFDSNGTFDYTIGSMDNTYRVTAINDHGMIAGSWRYSDDMLYGYGFVASSFSGGTSTRLAPLDPIPNATIQVTHPTDLNNHGQSVGWSNVNGTQRAVIWDAAGVPHDLGVSGHDTPRAINDRGMVTGDGYYIGAYLYVDGVVQPIPGLAGVSSSGRAINEAGDVVGYVGVPGALEGGQGFVYRNGVLDMIDAQGAHGSRVEDINNAGWAVGTVEWAPANIDPTQTSGFLYIDGELIDLTTLLEPGSGWIVRRADDINDRGQIWAEVCQAADCRWALLTPVPEPATLAMLAAGLPVLAFATRRRRCAGAALARGAA